MLSISSPSTVTDGAADELPLHRSHVTVFAVASTAVIQYLVGFPSFYSSAITITSSPIVNLVNGTPNPVVKVTKLSNAS